MTELGDDDDGVNVTEHEELVLRLQDAELNVPEVLGDAVNDTVSPADTPVPVTIAVTVIGLPIVVDDDESVISVVLGAKLVE